MRQINNNNKISLDRLEKGKNLLGWIQFGYNLDMQELRPFFFLNNLTFILSLHLAGKKK